MSKSLALLNPKLRGGVRFGIGGSQHLMLTPSYGDELAGEMGRAGGGRWDIRLKGNLGRSWVLLGEVVNRLKGLSPSHGPWYAGVAAVSLVGLRSQLLEA